MCHPDKSKVFYNAISILKKEQWTQMSDDNDKTTQARKCLYSIFAHHTWASFVALKAFTGLQKALFEIHVIKLTNCKDPG